jgi:DNA-binding transcriptional LysR family regulator
MSAPSLLSADEVLAFVELSRQGNLRRAAERLFLSEQGLRSRLVSLEQQLGVELYRKGRGRRTRTSLTAEGKQWLPQALAFLEQAEKVGMFFRSAHTTKEVHVVASHYLIAYVLIDAVRRFQKSFPAIRVRLSALSENQVEERLLSDPEIAFGVAAPYEASPVLGYQHLFSMDWSLITPRQHPLARKQRVTLADAVDWPLIFFEQGSTGRQHVAEALRQAGLSCNVELEASNTDLIVRMVEAGLGVSIVPLHPSGLVTRGRKVAIRPLGKQVRPIASGILHRKEKMSDEAAAFLSHVVAMHQN